MLILLSHSLSNMSQNYYHVAETRLSWDGCQLLKKLNKKANILLLQLVNFVRMRGTSIPLARFKYGLPEFVKLIVAAYPIT